MQPYVDVEGGTRTDIIQTQTRHRNEPSTRLEVRGHTDRHTQRHTERQTACSATKAPHTVT